MARKLECRAVRNCGFYANRANAMRRAESIAKQSQHAVSVYESAGTFHIYEGVESIVGFGECIAEFPAGKES